MELKTEEDRERIINFGAFDYPPQKMANILGLETEYIKNLMKDKNSVFYSLFQKGIDMADYVIDLKLFEMAKSGDIKALDKLEQRKKKRE